MANNPYVNKVELADGQTLIDISSDTVTPSSLMRGYTAHDASGASITGTAEGGGSGDGYVWQDGQGYVHLSDNQGTDIVGNIIADPYDSTATYAVGDYCAYNGLFYRCTTAISVAEAWNANHWTQTVVVDELSQGSGGGGEAKKVKILATLTSSSYSVSATAATGYSLSDVTADMEWFNYKVISGYMSSLTSDIDITTSTGAVTVSCSSAPTASVTLEIGLI